MTERLFLHVGLPKSGTTYVQAVLGENKDRLRDRAKLLYPGDGWAAQVRAARDVLTANPGGQRSPDVPGSWARLMHEVHAWDGDSIVSMEWLGSASPAQAQRIVHTAKPARVEIVLTVRDLARTVPAAWQEFMQNQEEWSWPEFLRAVTSENPRGSAAGDLFWSQQDVGRVLTIWRDVVPADQIHVVTVPPKGAAATELWMRLARVLGIEGEQYDASGRGSNESLGLQSAELMRRLNVVSRAKGLDWPTYDEMFKHALAKRGLSKHKHREDVLLLPSTLDEWSQAQAQRMVDAVKSAGVDVVGDLADLRPALPSEPVSEPHFDSDELLDVALEGLVALARDRHRELVELRRRRAEPPGVHGVRSTLVSASEKKPWLMAVRRRYRWARDRWTR